MDSINDTGKDPIRDVLKKQVKKDEKAGSINLQNTESSEKQNYYNPFKSPYTKDYTTTTTSTTTPKPYR